MNRNIFKIIFNKRTGKMNVVSEITIGEGKAASESTQTSNSSWAYRVTANPISFALMLTMGTAAVIPANAQVVADGNAPGNQRPTILNTASGATQANITTPSAAGVSMNQYSRFDVNNPLILNNSRTSVNTQTAGMVQGNPFLATGSARVIVNQVNGNLARINNSIEIAGPRSELIIAAPAGIMVNGGSIINASRTTLTTGTPIINGGNLEGYRVTQGQISIDGSGLDTSQSDYTDILARSVQANAGIWAKNLNVVTGANQIDGNNNASIIAGEGAVPAYALDSSALGGMYANKITFIGTEKGLGVNNAGQIAAAAGSVTISNDGLLSNSGTISSNGQDNATTVNTTAVHNSGTISAQGNTQIQTSAELQNSGTVTSGRELKVNSNTIDNSNGVLNGQRVEINTNDLNNTKGKIQQTGATQALALNAGSINNVNNGIIGYAPEEPVSGGGSSGGSTGGSSGGSTGSGSTDTPTTAAGGGTSTVVQPAPLPTLTDGVINVTGNLNNDAGQITANGGMDLTSNNGLTNHATLNLNKLNVSGNILDNSSGTITTTQLTANTNSINNTAGKLGSSGNIDLTAQSLTNSSGQITSAGTVKANIAQAVLNDNGIIASTNALTLNSGSLNNSSGTISANTANADVTSSGAIDNTKGTIQAATALNITGNGLNNTDGVINGATTVVNAQTAALNNTRGSITGDTLTLNSGALINEAGLIQGKQTLAINTHGQTLTNTDSGGSNGGNILSGGTLIIDSGILNNTAGHISSSGAQTLTLRDLVNGNSGQVNSDSTLDITSDRLMNMTGTISAAERLDIAIAQDAYNSSGTIVGNGTVTFNAGTLNNAYGTIASTQANANITSANAINNTGGILQAATALSVTGNGLNNTDGKINGTATIVNAQTAALNNTRGSIAGDTLTVNSGALTNDAGLIQGTQTVNLNTHGQTLTNINSGTANGIISGGTLAIQSGDLNNNTGIISSNADTTLNAANITSQSGSISSLGNATITGTGFDNQGGQVQSIGNTSISVGGGTVNNNNGLIRTDGDATINAANIINTNTNVTDKGIEGANVTLNTENVDNTSGAIRADETLAIIGAGTVNNTSGLITSSKAVVIQDPNATTNPAAKTQTVINTNGTISAGTSNTIDSKSLTGDGKITSNQDLAISINTDYANTGELTADGKLTLNTTGNLSNTSKISAGSDLNVAAQNIDNAANAEISGDTTTIHANDTLTNRGLIDGGDTVVTAGNTINNIGTGRIYGNHLSIGTNTLNNMDETVAGVNKAATIAAREDLDIGAQTINNIEHASLISLGDMRIGGALDSNNNATGKAAVINNNSATIESTGSMAINVGQLNNRNMHFATAQTVVGSEQRYYYRPTVAGPYYSSNDVYIIDPNGNFVTNPNLAGGADRMHPEAWNTTYTNYSPTGTDFEWYYRDVIAETKRTTVTQSDPGKIISGGAMNINLDNGLNDKSQIIAGGALTITGGTITNEQATGTEQTTERGKVVHTNVSNGGNGSRSFDTVDANYVNTYNPTTITLDGIAVQQQNVNATSGATIDALNTGSAGAASGAAGATASNTLAAANGSNVNTGTVTEIYATDTTDPTMIRTTGVNTAIPNSSLFSVNPNGNGYLIATDPRFTDASKWLSSDFMLKALNLDPANIHKRLGDGYYEQKLVKEQIAQLTGRRYLDGQNNDDEQYKALMNAGITFASQYNLRPGIALTPEQMARLTSDIVWLVEQTVTLPDGTKTTALVPQVYVRTRPGDITGSGALISGDSVRLNLTGDVNNKGNISGRTLTKIDANTINNINGRIGGGDSTVLNAVVDINNIGGSIEANNYLSAKAGRDVNVISTTSTATTNGKRSSTSNTGVDRIAGLYVNNPDGLLVVDAGRDVNLKGADVITESGGITSITAKNNINMTTVDVSNSSSTKKDSNNYVTDTATGEVGTMVNSGRVYMNAGNDINARQVSVYADTGVIDLTAGHDVILDAGKATSTASGAFNGKEGKTKYNYSGSSAASTDVGSTLSGQGVTIRAGNDMVATAANIDAGEGALGISAKHDVTIKEGHETLEVETHADSSKKGFLKKKSHTEDKARSSDMSLNSNLTGDTVTIIAGNDYTQSGSNVVGMNDVYIKAGNNATIQSTTDTYSESNSEENKKSGLMGGYDAGVLSIGYGKSKAAAQNSIDSSAQHVSTVASLNGNTTIIAGNHLGIIASDIGAGNNITLKAKDIDLEARQNVVDEHHGQQSKSSGFSMGITLNPYEAAKTAYDASRANTPKTGSVMNTLSREFDASNAALSAMTTPIVITAGSKRSSANQNSHTSTARTSSLTAGNNLTMIATEGSIDSQGTQMSAEGDALILARDNINFDVAHNYESQDSDSKSSGWSLDNRGGKTLMDTVGMFKNKANGNGVTDTITGTQLSVGGNTTLATMKGDITLTASNIVSNGDVDINAARNLTIQSGQDTVANENHSNNKAIGKVYVSDTERFSGYHNEKHNDNADQVSQVSSNVASLGGNVNLTAGEKYTQIASNVLAGQDVNITAKSIDLLTAQNTGTQHQDDKDLKIGTFARVTSPLIDLVNNVEAARKSDGRLKELQNMAAVANGVQAIAAATGKSGALFSVEVGVGVKSNKSEADAQYSIAQGSSINGGGNVNLTSTEGDIHGVQANLTAGKALTLDSANDILLEAGESQTHTSGDHSGWGVEVGVGASVGAQTGVYAYAQVNANSGKYETDVTTHGNSHLNADTINIKSKGDTTLKGADAHANTINADVGGKLAIESVQDTAEQHSKESGFDAKVQVSLGSAWGASGSANSSSANGTYTGVNQQSGLFAKDGGYHVNADTVDLKGGAITSTNAANSDLTANALTFSDLENKSSYDTSSAGLSFSTSTSLMGNLAGNLGNIVNMMGNGKPTDDASTTKATLTEGNITIGGQSTTAAATGINTDAATAHRALSELPDLQAVMADQKAEQAALNTISQTVAMVTREAVKANVGEAVERQKQAQAQLDAENASDNPDPVRVAAAEATLAEANANIQHWGPEGRYTIAVKAVGTIVTGLAADQNPQTIAAMIAAPLIANAIGDKIGSDNPLAKFAAHAVTAGVIAGLSGATTKEALAVGLAAGLTESVIAPAIAKEMFNKTVNELTPDEKETLLALSSVTGAIIAGLIGDSTTAAGYGASGTMNAVENNYLKADEVAERDRLIAAEPDEKKKRAIKDWYDGISQERNKAFAQACSPGGSGCSQWLDQVATDINALNAAAESARPGNTKTSLKGEAYRTQSIFLTTVSSVLNSEGKGNSVADAMSSNKLTWAQKQTYSNIFKGEGAFIGATVAAGILNSAAGRLTSGTTANATGCFVAGTLVHTPNGVQAIETLNQGALVLSRSDEHSAVGYKHVMGLKVTPNQLIYRLSVANVQGETESIDTTSEHPFWVHGHGWLKAEFLEAGMTLLDEHDQPLMVQSLEQLQRVETVYNIEVEDWNTYFVGKLAVWVHNACVMTTPQATVAAKAIGYTKVPGQLSKNQAVYYNPNASKDMRYITQDIGSGNGSGSHNGGVWKAAGSVQELGSKTTRTGTFDANLNPIGK